MSGSAVISPCGTFRYSLRRTWNELLAVVAIVMLNPSTADATADDPTVRKCVTLAARAGFGGIVVVNLFAFRATDPAALRERVASGLDAVGPQNDAAIRDAARDRPAVVAWGAAFETWGRQRDAAEDRAWVVRRIVREASRTSLRCWGETKSGHPRHPLYLPNASDPRVWSRGFQ